MALHTYLSIITLNVNGLNALTKRHRVVAEWIRKEDPYVCCLRDTSQIGRYAQTKSKVMGKNISYKCKGKNKLG